jgi:hypothetical protein
MRQLILTLLLITSYATYSQDLITLRNGEQIDCKITKVDSIIVYYDFLKGERKLSTYISIKDIRSYKINENTDYQNTGSNFILSQDNTVLIDTTQYLKETNKWINLITYSKRFGIHANGWAIQYYGYNLKSTAKWLIPIVFGIESFEIDSDYFSQFGYQSVNMSYYTAGVSPFYKIDDNFFLNLGINIIYGQEQLLNYNGNESFNTFFGLSPSQGIYYIPQSKFGIIVGLSIYEKLLSSQAYKNDLGVKLEIGIKF